MAKKNTRKPTGAARIAVIEDELDDATDEVAHESNGIQSDSIAAKPKRTAKAKPEQ